MQNLLGDGASWIIDQLQQDVSVPGIYRRGTSAVAVQLTCGKSEFSTYDDEGNLVTEVTDATFICAKTALVLGGKVVDPIAGDRIEMIRGTQTMTYEVMARGNLQPFSCDASLTLLRINTKLVKTQ